MEPQAPPPPVQQQNGMSIASMVLGICSFIGLCFTAIPAVITGHIALNRASKEPARYGGKGMAITGLVLGYVFIALSLVAIPAGLLLPALAKSKSRASRVSCVSNLKQVVLAARIYSNDHGDKFPPDFLTMSNELSTPRILVCNADKQHVKAIDWAGFSAGANVTYEFLAPGIDESKITSPGTTVVFRCPVHGNEAYADGSVMQRPPKR